MTTRIDALQAVEEYYDSSSDDEVASGSSHTNKLSGVIMRNSKHVDARLRALDEYYTESNEADALSLITTLISTYQMSGLQVLEEFFVKICTHSKIPTIAKLEVAKALITYEEPRKACIDSASDDSYITAYQARRDKRKARAYNALDFVCYDLAGVPAPCRVEAILFLMKSRMYDANAIAYMREFIRDSTIECQYKYTKVLDLEKLHIDDMRDRLRSRFADKVFVQKVYSDMESSIRVYFGQVTTDRNDKSGRTPLQLPLPSVNDEKSFNLIIDRALRLEELKYLYMDEFPSDIIDADKFIHDAQYVFVTHDGNDVKYRILAGQYLLQRCTLSDNERKVVENNLLQFATRADLPYSTRSDAADTLLHLGSDVTKQTAQLVITELGRNGAVARTVFDDAQNVHTQAVEESVSEALEFLVSVPTLVVDGIPVDLSYVVRKIEGILEETRDSMKVGRRIVADRLQEASSRRPHTTTCTYCGCDLPEHATSASGTSAEIFCVDSDCATYHKQDEKIRLALCRISVDRALYSKINFTLANILVKVWSYIVANKDHEDELIKRLLEELEEMSGWCSTGFATRLVNVISGFGDFSVRISWEEQIIANFVGRLNAIAKRLASADSLFRTSDQAMHNVVELWLLQPAQAQLLARLRSAKLKAGTPLCSMRQIAEAYLAENLAERESRVDTCLEDFAYQVLHEMTVTSSNHADRRAFMLFFRTIAATIREEMYAEFKTYVSDADFDLYLRKAYMQYNV